MLHVKSIIVTVKNLLKTSSFNLEEVYEYYSLIAEKFFVFQQNSALTHRVRDSVWSGLWDRQHHSSYHQIKQPRHQLSRLQYLWHCPIACMSVLCVQNVNKLNQHLIDIGTACKYNNE